VLKLCGLTLCKINQNKENNQMKKLALVLALVLAFAPLGMAYFSPDDSDSVTNSIATTSSVQAAAIRIVPAVSTALASGATAGKLKIISNSAAAGSCASDGTGGVGTTQVVCVSNGTNWVAL
jgi:hypothetical protein